MAKFILAKEVLLLFLRIRIAVHIWSEPDLLTRVTASGRGCVKTPRELLVGQEMTNSVPHP